jgi:putative transposase
MLGIGKHVVIEDLSYKALQKMYGKSIGRRAPSLFVSFLGRKAESAGGYLRKIPTQTTRLSQACICGKLKKKSLSERWHSCDCGATAQRDLFSAFRRHA